MKFALFIILGLTFLLCGLSPQLRTRLRPAWPTVRRVRRKAITFGGAAWVVRVEFARVV